MSKNEKVTAIRDVYPHFNLNYASYIALKEAKNTQDKWDCVHFCMTSMLLCSFTLEAYFNLVGKSKIEFWDKEDLEKLSPEYKLQRIAKILKFSYDKSCRPFQTFKNIIKFRNLLVHAKPNVVTERTDKFDPKTPKSEWEKMVSIKMANIFNADTEKMLLFLQKNTDMIIDPIQAGGATFFFTDYELNLSKNDPTEP